MASRRRPEQVKVHDFADKTLGKANPYGVYDIGANTGWVSVGTDHDTAEFAVNTIATWWREVGKPMYPNAARLMISADGGGSNGYRTRLWKTELARLAAATGLRITVCHLPPGTSKWNKIEHRLFAHISMNWRGRPLTSHEVIVETIAATTTSTGLTVRAALATPSTRRASRFPTSKSKPLKHRASLHVTSSTASGTTPSTPNRNTPETDQVNSSQALSEDTDVSRWLIGPFGRRRPSGVVKIQRR